MTSKIMALEVLILILIPILFIICIMDSKVSEYLTNNRAYIKEMLAETNPNITDAEVDYAISEMTKKACDLFLIVTFFIVAMITVLIIRA